MGKRIAALIISLLVSTLAYAIDRTISIGDSDLWPTRMIDNLTFVTGLRGSTDLELMQSRYNAEANTELLIHFDELPLSDAAGRFQVEQAGSELSEGTRRSGRASLLSEQIDPPVSLTPGADSWFVPGTEWGSFSLEFWLYPVVLQDGEELFRFAAQEGAASAFREQELAIVIERRKLRISFVNFFVPPDQSAMTIELHGDRGLIPRKWSHHRIRFNDQTGLLEYLVDGVPVDLAYVSRSGREDGTVFFPRIAPHRVGSIEVAGFFTGAIDELRIMRGWTQDAAPSLYPDGGGYFESTVIDLGSTASTLVGLRPEARTPGQSDVFLYYRISDRRETDNSVAGPWVPLAPGREFQPAVGRFLQLRAELYPDPTLAQPPVLSTLLIDYQDDPPPLPPARLDAMAGDGVVELIWSPVQERDVTGYLLYYGDRPGQYFGDDADLGASPIRLGPATSVRLTGLQNGRLYYFAVSAVDAGGLREAQLSSEVAARPARVYR